MALSREEVFAKVLDVMKTQGLALDESEAAGGGVKDKKGKPVTEQTNFTLDCEADSLDGVELIMELEDTCKVKIPDEDGNNLLTVGAAVEYIFTHQVSADTPTPA